MGFLSSGGTSLVFPLFLMRLNPIILLRAFSFPTLQPASSVPLHAIYCDSVFPKFFSCCCFAAIIPMAWLPQAQWCCYFRYFWEAIAISIRKILLYHCSACCPSCASGDNNMHPERSADRQRAAPVLISSATEASPAGTTSWEVDQFLLETV